MRLEYERNIEDIINWNMYHMSRSPSIKQNILNTRIVSSIITTFITGGILYLLNSQITTSKIILSLLAGVIIFIITPSLYKSATIKNIKKLLKEASNESSLGDQAIELTIEGIKVSNRAGEGNYKWNSVIRVEYDKQQIYLYQSATCAIVIPKKAFKSEQDEMIFKELIDQNIPKS